MKKIIYTILFSIEMLGLLIFLLCILLIPSGVYMQAYSHWYNQSLPFAVPLGTLGNAGFCVTSSGQVIADSSSWVSVVLFSEGGKSGTSYILGGTVPNDVIVPTDNGNIVIGGGTLETGGGCIIFNENKGKVTQRFGNVKDNEVVLYDFDRKFKLVKKDKKTASSPNGIFTRKVCTPGSIVFMRLNSKIASMSPSTDPFYYKGNTYRLDTLRRYVEVKTLTGTIRYGPCWFLSLLGFPKMYFITLISLFLIHLIARFSRMLLVEKGILNGGNPLGWSAKLRQFMRRVRCRCGVGCKGTASFGRIKY